MKSLHFSCFIASLLASSVAHATELATFSDANLPNHIRTLAASCAACHGSTGNAAAGNAVLAGMDSAYFTKQMLAFKDGSRPATVMHHHAKGLHEDEINQLASYFSQKKRVINGVPKSQTLKANHEN
jgi:cytochrome subunit of sulfide dehydrogenase